MARRLLVVHPSFEYDVEKGLQGLTAIMIENIEIAETYKDHFEHLWRIASVKNA